MSATDVGLTAGDGAEAAGPFDDVLARATARLAADPELRLEVTHELRGHLEDAAAEYVAAGRDEAAARREAVAALGDPDALADQLWQAHRRRIRWRAGGRWAVGLAASLLAAWAIAVCVSVVRGAMTAVALLALIDGISNGNRDVAGTVPPLPGRLDMADRAWADMAARLPADSRLLMGPGPRVFSPVPLSEEIAQAKALAERWPGDPVLYANYATQNLHNVWNADSEPRPSPADWDRWVAVFDRGARVEPDNGYYPLMKAAVLFRRSARRRSDVSDADKPGYEQTGPDGKPDRRTFDRLEITDPAAFEQGLAALHEAAAKPYIDSHVVDLLRRRLDAVPAATLHDRLLRTDLAMTTLLPYLNLYRWAVEVAGDHAIAVAQAGQPERAEAIVADEQAVARRVLERSSLVIDLLVAAGLADLSEGHEAMIARAAGDEPRFLRIRDREAGEWRTRWRTNLQSAGGTEQWRQLQRRMGLLQSRLVQPGVAPATIDPAPGRRAEYAVADEVGLAAAVAVLLLAAGGCAVGWLLAKLAGRRGGAAGRTVAPFVGWRRLAGVVAGGAVAPLAVYLAFARVPAVGGRNLGLGLTWPRLALEYLVLAAVVVGLVGALTGRAIRRRARELGFGRPAGGRRGPWPGGWAAAWVGLLIATAGVGCFIAWYAWLARRVPTPTVGWLLPAAVVAGMALVAVRILHGRPGRGRPAEVDPARPRRRRPARAFVLAFVAVALACLGWALRDAGRYTSDGCPILVTVGVACALGLACTGLAGGIRAAARALRPKPAAVTDLTWARSVALAYAAAAVVAGGLGWAALRWQERAAVARMEGPGYALVDETNGSRYESLREYWLGVLPHAAGEASPAARSETR